MDLEEKLNAIRNRDKKYRGRFFVAVKTTRIVCSPDCPAKPLEKNIMVYDTLEEALQAGYRPCKICMKDMNIRKKNIITIHQYNSPCGVLMLGSFGDKLCLCDWQVERHRNHVGNRLKRILNAEFEEGVSPIIDMAIKQLNEYFAGKRTIFDVPLLFVGTDFQKKVWNHLLTVPFGKTISYGEMAKEIGMPKAVRTVANANGANSMSIFAPCHRIIGSDKSLTGYGGGLEAKEYLLKLEHVLP